MSARNLAIGLAFLGAVGCAGRAVEPRAAQDTPSRLSRQPGIGFVGQDVLEACRASYVVRAGWNVSITGRDGTEVATGTVGNVDNLGAFLALKMLNGQEIGARLIFGDNMFLTTEHGHDDFVSLVLCPPTENDQRLVEQPGGALVPAFMGGDGELGSSAPGRGFVRLVVGNPEAGWQPLTSIEGGRPYPRISVWPPSPEAGEK